jgi:hypothetical protein
MAASSTSGRDDVSRIGCNAPEGESLFSGHFVVSRNHQTADPRNITSSDHSQE